MTQGGQNFKLQNVERYFELDESNKNTQKFNYRNYLWKYSKDFEDSYSVEKRNEIPRSKDSKCRERGGGSSSSSSRKPAYFPLICWPLAN